MKAMMEIILEALSGFPNHPNIGIFYAIMSSASMSLGHFLVRVTTISTINRRLSSFGVYLVHCYVQIAMLILPLFIHKTHVLFSSDKWLHIFFMSFSRFLADITMFWAVSLIPMTIAVALYSACPLFAILFSCCILKETCLWYDSFCCILSVTGVFLITRSPSIFMLYKRTEKAYNKNVSHGDYETVHTMGCMIALLSSIASGLAFVLQRKWAKSESGKGKGSYLINVLYSSVLGCLLTPVIMVIRGDRLFLPDPTYARWSFFALGIPTTLGLTSLALSLRTQHASVAALVRNFDVVLIYTFQYIDLYIPFSWWSGAGTTVIIFSIVFATLRERVLDKSGSQGCIEWKSEEGISK